MSDLLRTVEESKRTIEQLTDDVQDLEIDIGKHEGKVMRVQKIADDYIIKVKKSAISLKIHIIACNSSNSRFLHRYFSSGECLDLTLM